VLSDAYKSRVVSRHYQDVTRKIDLVRLCRVGEEAGTLDLHVNFAPNYVSVVGQIIQHLLTSVRH
jgi:hypothetical protein